MAEAITSPPSLITENEGINRTLLAATLFQTFDGQRDYHKSLGYPTVMTVKDYWDLYARGDVAKVCITWYPDECWQVVPSVRDNNAPQKSAKYEPTPFEQALEDLIDACPDFWRAQHEADRLAGIFQYGLLVLGLTDGAESLADPVVPGKDVKLQYLRAFSDRCVNIAQWDYDVKSPRYGLPIMYNVVSVTALDGSGGGINGRVHWTRCVHIAEEPIETRVFSVPRLQPVINRIYDAQKALGASAEMFWLGAFGGKAFIADKDANLTPDMMEKMKAQMQDYIHGLQRYLTMQGVQVHDLSGSPASPKDVVDLQLQFISATLRIPMRAFLGTESGQNAGNQDERAVIDRVKMRRENFCGPVITHVLLERLINAGVLPTPQKEKFWLEWPNGNNMTVTELADLSLKQTQAVQAYVTSGMSQLITFLDFLEHFLGIERWKAEQIAENGHALAQQQIAEDAASSTTLEDSDTENPHTKVVDEAQKATDAMYPPGEKGGSPIHITPAGGTPQKPKGSKPVETGVNGPGLAKANALATIGKPEDDGVTELGYITHNQERPGIWKRFKNWVWK